jgi:hypothetical protein
VEFGYFEGSYSNGPSWNLVASSAINTSLWDFAHGSATTDNGLIESDFVPGTSMPSPDVFQQVANYELRLASQGLKEETIHALWIGANNYYRTSGSEPTEAQVASYVNSTLANARSIVNAASSSNATYSGRVRLVVFGIYPLQHSPALHTYFESATYYGLIAERVELHNRLLQTQLAEAVSEAETAFLDTTSILLSSPVFDKGILDKACVQNETCYKEGKRDGWLWWDGWHLTGSANKVLADSFAGVFGLQIITTGASGPSATASPIVSQPRPSSALRWTRNGWIWISSVIFASLVM